MNNKECHPIILFDGICNLCNASVQYVIRHDSKQIFRFASLQSRFGQEILSNNNLPVNDFNSFVLFDDNKVFTRSTAALKVARKLNGFIKLLYAFIIFRSLFAMLYITSSQKTVINGLAKKMNA